MLTWLLSPPNTPLSKMSTLPQYRIVYWCYILQIYIPSTLKRVLFNLYVLSFTAMVPGVCIVPYLNTQLLTPASFSHWKLRASLSLLKRCYTKSTPYLKEYWKILVFWDMFQKVWVIGGPTSSAHSKSCKIWHIPSENIPLKSGSDPRLKSLCTECREVTRYIEKKVTAKKNVDETTRMKRQMPNSHFPRKFLSPGSKSKRTRNLRQQRSRAIKQALKFYKKTKVELPSNQSKELCQLIQAIENSEAGKRELGKIVEEGNQFEGKGSLKAGDCVSETWRKDREEFLKD